MTDSAGSKTVRNPQHQPPFLTRRRSLSERAWRLFLLFGLFFWAAAILPDAAQTHWRDAWHDLLITCAYWLVISFERTLDRWEPFVPPSVRGRRP